MLKLTTRNNAKRPADTPKGVDAVNKCNGLPQARAELIETRRAWSAYLPAVAKPNNAMDATLMKNAATMRPTAIRNGTNRSVLVLLNQCREKGR
jgi:hypothetical protein